jgi:hypothetical protein
LKRKKKTFEEEEKHLFAEEESNFEEQFGLYSRV